MNSATEIQKLQCIGLNDGRSYPIKAFNLSRLHGLRPHPRDTLQALQSPVKQTNLLPEQLAEFSRRSPSAPADSIVCAELSRRLGFEYNCMVFRGQYFANPKKSVSATRSAIRFFTRRRMGYGTYRNWKTDFIQRPSDLLSGSLHRTLD